MKNTSTAISRRAWMGGVGLAAGLAGAGLAWRHWQPTKGGTSAAEAEFWQQTFERPEGGEVRPAQWRGQPLLVNFWATWCPPCVEELPMMEAFWQQNAANGFQVLALAVDQPSAVKRFLSRQTLSFPIGLAGLQGTALARSLGNAGGGLPFSVFFGTEGNILRIKLGQMVLQDLLQWRDSVRV